LDYGHKFSTDHFHECTWSLSSASIGVQACLGGAVAGASVARIAREHCVNANQVFSWRRLYQQGRLGVPASVRDDGLLSVVLAPTAPAPSNTSSDADGVIVLELGEVRVRIEGQPNATILAQVLDRVLR